MLGFEKSAFDVEAFFADAGVGRAIVKVGEMQSFFSQGEAADSVFYLQSGHAKLTVLSDNCEEATITFLSASDFVGEESLASADTLYLATASATSDCTALKLERAEMLRAIRKEQSVPEKFMKFLLARGMRIESDLIDQLFNSSEKRLSRILLKMDEFGKQDGCEGLVPEITEEELAQMICVPRSDVSFFMSRYHELGLIDYDGGIRVHRALLNAILHDQMPGDNTVKPAIAHIRRRQSE